MGGPRRVILAVAWALLALAAVVLIWFTTLKPEVKQIIFREVFGLGANITQTDTLTGYGALPPGADRISESLR